MRRRGGARVLERRLLQQLTRGRAAVHLAALGCLGRSLGQRVLLHGSVLRDHALGQGWRLGDGFELAVSGDVLGFARDLVARHGGRWWPTVHGPGAAVVQQGGRTLVLEGLRGGLFPFLAARPYTVDGLGYDLTEPGGILDGWGGLEDAAQRRLVPSGDQDPGAGPGPLLRGLTLELRLGLDPSPRLVAAMPRLGQPDFMARLPPLVFWDLVDGFLVPGGAAAFRDGRLSLALSAFLEGRGEAPPRPRPEDAALLEVMDSLEHALRQGQILERGCPGGAGLSSAARLAALLRLRAPGRSLAASRLGPLLGRGAGVARALEALDHGVTRLLELGFPYRPGGRAPGRDPIFAAAALLAAASAVREPGAGTVARIMPDPGVALRCLLGPRVPRAA